MQPQNANTRSAGAVNHPGAEEWMAYLYDEIAPERKRELAAHLTQCAACGQQLNQWRAGMVALDDWRLTTARHKAAWQPAAVVKWAVAAAVVLCAGIGLGRMSSTNAREVAELKASVAQLTEKINNQPAGEANNSSVTKETHDDLIQLFANYSKLNEERRTEDRQVVGRALRDMELRIANLRTELETVALNTESGFRKTKEGLTTLASYAVPDQGNQTDLKVPETKINH